ncbi:MAG: FG-GAP repeat domain-containing protein, partial [Planctomycetaceae bacterium]
RVIIDGQTDRDNVCIAPMDIDGDGKIDFAVGAGWTKIGTIYWLSRGQSLDDRWQVHAISAERWLHRMRFADVLGKGKPQLVVSPLNATMGQGVRLLAFEIPQNPKADRWQSTVMNDELNQMHNHWHIDFDRDGIVDTLTASREGVSLVRKTESGWSTRKLAVGAQSEKPNQNGAGEIKVGRLGNARLFLAAVEPMHGDTLAVYTAPEKDGELWTRNVIDRGFQRGHAIWTADFDKDGTDEIVFGHSDTPNVPGVNVYHAEDATGSTWKKSTVDAGGVATEDLIVEDVTGDGYPDIIAGGRQTHNVKLYVHTP